MMNPMNMNMINQIDMKNMENMEQIKNNLDKINFPNIIELQFGLL